MSIRRIVCALAALFALSVRSFAAEGFGTTPRGAQELVPCGHWVYDALEAISLEARVLNFADSAPCTVQQIRTMLFELDYDALSAAGRAQYDRITAYFGERALSVGSDLLHVGIEPTFNLEGYYKTNDDIGWTFDRYSRHGLIEAPVNIGVGDWATLSATMTLQPNKGAGLRNDTYVNIPFSGDDFDTNFPHSAYFSTGAKLTEKTGVHFMVNQGTQSVGRTQTGSIIISDYMTEATTARLSAYSSAVRYAASVTELNVNKYFYAHEMNLRFFKRVSVTLLEGLLVYAPLELRHLNPWTIYHGFAAWRDYGTFDGDRNNDDPESHTCDYFGVKLEVLPVRGVRLYGLFAMTQYQTPYERANWSDSPTPDGLGFQGGGEWYLPVGAGYFHFGLEGVYTQPYLYIKESPNWSMARTYSEVMGDHAIFYEWIGSPFGPDTVSASLSAGYERPGVFGVDVTYLFMARGEQSGTRVFDELYERTGWGGQSTDIDENTAEANWCYPTSETLDRVDWLTPTGTPEYVNRLSVRGTWYAKPWLTLVAQPAYVLIFNHNNEHGETAHGFEIALAVQFSPLKMR